MTTLAGPMDRRAALGWADRFQPLILLGSVCLGLLIGVGSPALGELAASAVPIGVFVLISLVLVGVRPGAVAAARNAGGFLRVAIVLNFVVNPVIAWAVSAAFLGDRPDLRIGMLLFLLTPCVGWYLAFSDLGGGDRSLAVSLLGVNLVLQLLTLPLYLAWFVGGVGVPVAEVVRSVILFLVLPGVVAAAARGRLRVAGVSGQRAERVLGSAKTLALVFVIVAMFASTADQVVDSGRVLARIVPPLLVFFTAAFATALIVARVRGMPHDQAVVLAFTATSRNSEASLAIAATAFADPLVAVTVVLGPVVELPLLVAMLPVLERLRGSFVVGATGQT